MGYRTITNPDLTTNAWRRWSDDRLYALIAALENDQELSTEQERLELVEAIHDELSEREYERDIATWHDDSPPIDLPSYGGN